MIKDLIIKREKLNNISERKKSSINDGKDINKEDNIDYKKSKNKPTKVDNKSKMNKNDKNNDKSNKDKRKDKIENLNKFIKKKIFLEGVEIRMMILKNCYKKIVAFILKDLKLKKKE
jgi:hypothetical protein